MLLSSGDCDPFFARWLLGEAVKAAGQACSSATKGQWLARAGLLPVIRKYLSLSLCVYISKSALYGFPSNTGAAGMVPGSWSGPWCPRCFSGNWQPTLGAASSAGNNSVWFLFVSRDNSPADGLRRRRGGFLCVAVRAWQMANWTW